MSQSPVEITESDSSWPQAFEKERKLLLLIIGEWLYGSIEPVCCTSVPGRVAKPVMDVRSGIGSLQDSRPAIDVLARHAYVHFPYKEDIMQWLCTPADEDCAHHLHLGPYRSQPWNKRIEFREMLLGDSSVAKRHSDL